MTVPPSELIPAIRSAQSASQRSPEEIQRLRLMPYSLYLQTGWWRRVRNETLWRAGYRCQRCGGKRQLQVHHLSYDRRGDEHDDDLEVLCRGCHAGEHFNEVQNDIGLYMRVISDVLQDGGRDDTSDIIEEAKARCKRLRIPYKHEPFQAAVSQLMPRFPFHAPRGKEELYEVGKEHQPLSRTEAAAILARLGASGLMRHIPEVQPLTVREMEKRRALQIVAQAIVEQVQRCEAVEREAQS